MGLVQNIECSKNMENDYSNIEKFYSNIENRI